MKKLLTAILLALACSVDHAHACGWEVTYNYYLFDVLDGTFCQDNLISERCDQFWKTYTGGEVEQYRWNADNIMKIAQKKGDQEMTAYLTELNKYLDICEQLQETWEYPTREQLDERQATLRNMARQAQSYNGKRLKSQWALLYMRANMVMKQHQANVDYWNQTARRLPDNVYREMMENIYAGALMNTGHRKEAIDLFAKQGDLKSIRWLMRKQRNLDGIKSVYAEDAASPSLPFLVQDFVNNAQETLDNTDREDQSVNDEWMKEIDARVILRHECHDFIDFARRVLSEGKTPCPALWQAAVGELQYLYGDHASAYATLTEAMTMAGSQKMKDNARAIRVVVAVGARFGEKDFARWMSGELQWLYDESLREADCAYHYRLSMLRLVRNELAPAYAKAGNPTMATALYGMLDDYEVRINHPDGRPEDDSYNPNYSSWHGYTEELNKMSGDQLVAFAQWCQQKGGDDMERFVRQHIKADPTYFDDMAGTHYLGEGRFEKAIPYLKRVPLSFMEGQNISFYLAHRDFTRPRWFGRQAFSEKIQTDGAHLGKLSDNPKLRFCEEMIRLQKAYNKAKGTERQHLALQLATRFYQASCQGDCWYLCRYAHSVYDEAEYHEMDFVDAAKKLLHESALSSDFDIRQESLFALAFIPLKPADDVSFWGDKIDWTQVLPNRNADDMAALGQFYRQYGSRVATYVSKCDVLKAYMGM